jgi:hypothetical protein
VARAFDVGGGLKLYVECSGSGKPTILLEAGDQSDMYQWSLVRVELAAETRTCTYDRAGLGSSDPAHGCRQLDDLLDDTESVLRAAEIEPPYLMVGTSGGGYLMAGLAIAIRSTWPAWYLWRLRRPSPSFRPGCDARSGVHVRPCLKHIKPPARATG